MTPQTYGLAALGAALALSLAANGVVGHAYLSNRDELATVKQQAEQSAGAAKSCSAGVDALANAANVRAAKAEGAREAALQLAREAQSKGLKLVAKPPAVPGNDCASARIQTDDWLSTRGAK